MIDWLKTKGPFWKYEKTSNFGHWVEALESDNKEERKWNSQSCELVNKEYFFIRSLQITPGVNENSSI